MTQKELAEKLGVSGQAVSKWENNVSCPNIMLLPAIAELFGITTDELLSGKKPPEIYIVPKEKRKKLEELMLVVEIDDDDDRINVNIPLMLIKTCLEIGVAMPQLTAKVQGIEKIDFSQIILLAENGMLGKIVDIESSDGSTIRVFVQ